MRSERLLNSLFPDYEAAPSAADKARGRNDALVRQRNERMCARVYYLRIVKRMRNEDIMKQIMGEFDISASTIPQILQEEEWQDYLLNLKVQKPGRKWFKGKWPGVVW